MKGYNLYTDLDTAADALRLPFLQVAVWDEATNLIDLHPDLVQRAMAHRWYGNAAYLANMPDLARREFSAASSLFALAPKTEATFRGRLDADIWLAGLAVRTGDIEQATALLENIQENLRDAPGFPQEVSFHTAKAQLSLLRGDLSGCEFALRSVIFLAESARSSFASDSARRLWAEQTSNSYRTLVAWKLRQGDISAALEYWEWYKGAEFRSSSDAQQSEPRRQALRDAFLASDNPPSLPNPTNVAQQLPTLQHKTVLTYAVFPEGISAWAYSDRGISNRWIAKSEWDLRESTTRFLRLCAERESNIAALQSNGRELYNLLISPFEIMISNDRTLVIEPDGPLSGIPFDALVDSHGHYLLDRTSIVISPGLYRLNYESKFRPIGPRTSALIVSVPAINGGNVTPSSDAEAEANEVARQFDAVKQLRGTDASIEAIRRDIVAARVFHFAGHALNSPESDGLLINDEESGSIRPQLLNAESINTEDLRQLQLAVLSACATGADPGPGASGTESLTAKILRAGVPDVIASRWNVDSESTRLLMARFYKELLSGRDAARSLRISQLELRTRPGMAHPYYWASFGVQGI
jgi:CHAT domain-containing protein